jgi:diaminohydroxyphosphoribosylaminopyrimidine deaminase / 5-amino-6-(5-phosphoribosylamino)uracil reductase
MAMTTVHHAQFMQRALFLASLGLGKSAPHPMAGGVIVKNQKVIAEGWHENIFSIPLLSHLFSIVQDKSLLINSTLYLSTIHDTELLLYFDLLSTYKVSGIVIANLIATDVKRSDLFHKLQEMDIEIITGILEEEQRVLNHRFYFTQQHHIPYVILKWAQTADGFITRENYDSKWISNAHSRKIVHKWRTEEDAILVGSNTCQYDNPRLNARDWQGNNPLRVIIDRHLRLPSGLHVFDQTQPTICYNLVKSHREDNLEFVNLSAYITSEHSFIYALLSDLFQRKIHSLIVEGGSVVLDQFIREGCWNEARVFQAAHTFKQGIKAPSLAHATLHTIENYTGDQLFLYKNVLETK